MEYLTQWEFWQEIALSVAARLSVIAAALWGVKMVTDRLTAKPAAPSPGSPTAETRETVVLSLPGLGGRVEEFRSARPVRRPLTLKAAGTAGAPEAEIWCEKMAKYLSSESNRAGKALQR
jgi:hypothetical protein